nr:hypothetical protein [Tanacetum cinerariifolium]
MMIGGWDSGSSISFMAVYPNHIAAVWLDLLHSGLPKPLHGDKMVEENVPDPTRTDAQLVLVKERLPIGKSNLLMDLQKMQKNPIFRFSVDILQNTNFFRAFTASAGVPLIYTQYLQKAQSPGHITVDDYPLNNLKFVRKGEVDEVFRMHIPKDLSTYAIWNSNYYKKYLEMAARKPRQPRKPTTMIGEEVRKKKKALKAGMSKLLAPTKQPKPVKMKTSKPTPSKKIHKGKRSNHLVDEEDEEGQPASGPQVESDEYNLQKGIQMSLKSLQAQGQTLTQDASTGPSAQSQDDTSVNVVHDTLSLTDSTNDAENVADMEQSISETDTKILNVVEEQGDEVLNTMELEERIVEFDKGQARSDPGKTPESQPLPELELKEEDQAGSNPRQSHVAQAGPNPKPMHEDFITTVYPKVHESLKLTTEKQVHIENSPSSSETLSSMKNLEDAFTFVESMVTVPIHQASSSVLPLSSPIIDLSPLKPVSPPVQEPIITAATTTLPPPQSSIDPDLATRVSALEKRKILHDRMFESNSYRSHPDHTTLYKALEVSMQREKNDELHEALDTSPPQRKKLASPSKQLVNDDLILEDIQLSESKDADDAHLPKIKTRPDWLKLLLEEETPEPDWVIPPNQIDWVNPEGNRCVHDMSKPLPRGGPPCQNQKDLPRDNPLVSVEVLRYDIKRSKSENKGIVSTEMELVLEQTQ